MNDVVIVPSNHPVSEYNSV